MQTVILEPISTKNRNKVSIQKICPPIPKNELVITNNTILGISIGSPASSGNKALAIFKYLHSLGINTIHCFLGDHLYRFTAMIKYDCSEGEGKLIGIKNARGLREEYAMLLSQLSNPPQLHYLQTTDIEADKNFDEIYATLFTLFSTNEQFKNTVLSFSNFYFDRLTLNNKEEKDLISTLDCASRYLLEELTIFAILKKRGLNILIYPGVIQTIYDIITMEHPYLKELFEDYIFISLRISRN